MNLFLTFLAFVWIAYKSQVSTAPMLSLPATMSYLQKYGYMQGESSDNMQGPIANFQKMMNMKPTGIMDKETSEAMHKPRCGMADMSKNKKLKPRRWNKEKLTYRVRNNANPERSKVSPNNMRNAIEEAFKIWSDQTNLVFTQVGGNDHVPDIDIVFAKGRHLADHEAFDGPVPEGMELAHAGYPTLEDPILAGDVHFDDDEIWVLNPRTFNDKEFNFLYVAVHEIGHALGLTHTDEVAIMGPMYQNTTNVQLQKNDVKRIQELYGPPRTRSRFSARLLAQDICEDPKIDAAFSTVDGSTYVIKDERYWKLTGTGLDRDSYPVNFAGMWTNGPSKVDAAFTNIEKGKTFFVEGSQVWRYSQYKQDMKADLRSLFKLDLNGVDAILKGSDSDPTYFFKGNVFRKKVGLKISSGLIADVFKGVPNDLDAAVMYKRKDNQPADPVFFKGNKCYYRRYTPSSTPGKAGQFTREYVEAETKVLFGCPP